MKLIQILTNPLVQVISFCIILVGSPEFGGPFGFFIFHAAQEGYAFAIIGAIAIVLTLAPFIMTRISSYLQISGSLLMVISFLLYIFSSTHFRNVSTFHEIIPLATLLIFVIVIILVLQKNIAQLKRHA